MTVSGSWPGEGEHTITFLAMIDGFSDLTPGATAIINKCELRTSSGITLDRCRVKTPLNFKSSISIEKSTNGEDADTGTGPVLATRRRSDLDIRRHQ